MLLFLEEYLQKKMKVAEYLYLYGKDFSRDEASKKIGLSVATLNQYVSEIYTDFKEEYQGGILLNSQSLEKVCFRLFSESKKLEALRLLIDKPGRSAVYYTDQLMISSASFSRVVASLKDDLTEYELQLVIRNGYRIEGKDNMHVVALSTFMTLCYRWPVDTLYSELENYVGADAIKELASVPQDRFPQNLNTLPTQIYHLSMLRGLLRMYQIQDPDTVIPVEQFRKDYELVITEIWSLVTCSEEKVHKAMPRIVEECFPRGLSVDKKMELENFLVQIVSDHSSFPYSISTIPVRMVFFNRKQQINNPSRIPAIDTFIYRASKILRVNLTERYDSVFYHILTMDLLDFVKQSKVELFVYSAIGHERNEYLKKQIDPLMGYFSKDSTITTYVPHQELPRNKNVFLITTDALDQFPIGKQFLISDYISLADYLSIMSWILEKVRIQEGH